MASRILRCFCPPRRLNNTRKFLKTIISTSHGSSLVLFRGSFLLWSAPDYVVISISCMENIGNLVRWLFCQLGYFVTFTIMASVILSKNILNLAIMSGHPPFFTLLLIKFLNLSSKLSKMVTRWKNNTNKDTNKHKFNVIRVRNDDK